MVHVLLIETAVYSSGAGQSAGFPCLAGREIKYKNEIERKRGETDRESRAARMNRRAGQAASGAEGERLARVKTCTQAGGEGWTRQEKCGVGGGASRAGPP